MSISNYKISIIFVLRGGGGGGVQAYNFGKFDFEIWVEEKGHFVRVVLGPCAQCCPCEVSKQINGAKNQNLHLRR